jgi:hypothetical protein
LACTSDGTSKVVVFGTEVDGTKTVIGYAACTPFQASHAVGLNLATTCRRSTNQRHGLGIFLAGFADTNPGTSCGDNPEGNENVGLLFDEEGFLGDEVGVEVTVIGQEYSTVLNVTFGTTCRHFGGEHFDVASYLAVAVIDGLPVQTVNSEDGTVLIRVFANAAVNFVDAVES